MDFATIVGSVMASLGISASTAAWLSKRFVDHRLSKDMEAFKSELTRELARDKASWEGQIRQEVELFLGDRAADREYQLEARKRLYSSIGPLKFQLVVACRDYSNRIVNYGLGTRYATDIGGYYGKSTLYRLLKPFALSELLERQMTYFDFSVDPSVASLLQFKRAAYASLTSGSIIVEGQQGVEWRAQQQHVFYDNLSRASNAMIKSARGGGRVLRFHEFDEFVQAPDSRRRLEPLPELFREFDIVQKPIWWIRLVTLALLCNEFERAVGANVGFDQADFPLARLLAVSTDEFVLAHLADYELKCRELVQRAGLPNIAPIAPGPIPAGSDRATSGGSAPTQ
jgi:hypothetical protein